MLNEQMAIPTLLDLPVADSSHPWMIALIVLLILVVVGQLSDRFIK